MLTNSIRIGCSRDSIRWRHVSRPKIHFSLDFNCNSIVTSVPKNPSSILYGNAPHGNYPINKRVNPCLMTSRLFGLLLPERAPLLPPPINSSRRRLGDGSKGKKIPQHSMHTRQFQCFLLLQCFFVCFTQNWHVFRLFLRPSGGCSSHTRKKCLSTSATDFFVLFFLFSFFRPCVIDNTPLPLSRAGGNRWSIPFSNQFHSK